MTLEQAIEFCLNMEREQYKSAHNTIRGDYPEYEAAHHFRLASEYKQLAEWLRELKEAKRLLKSAIDEWNLVCEWGDCGEYCGWYQNGRCTQEWSGKAKALKLIGEDGDTE